MKNTTTMNKVTPSRLRKIMQNIMQNKFCVNIYSYEYAGHYEIHNMHVCKYPNRPRKNRGQYYLDATNWHSAIYEALRYYPVVSPCACKNCEKTWPNKWVEDRKNAKLYYGYDVDLCFYLTRKLTPIKTIKRQ